MTLDGQALTWELSEVDYVVLEVDFTATIVKQWSGQTPHLVGQLITAAAAEQLDLLVKGSPDFIASTVALWWGYSTGRSVNEFLDWLGSQSVEELYNATVDPAVVRYLWPSEATTIVFQTPSSTPSTS